MPPFVLLADAMKLAPHLYGFLPVGINALENSVSVYPLGMAMTGDIER
jgi:hypothetical protein